MRGRLLNGMIPCAQGTETSNTAEYYAWAICCAGNVYGSYVSYHCNEFVQKVKYYFGQLKRENGAVGSRERLTASYPQPLPEGRGAGDGYGSATASCPLADGDG